MNNSVASILSPELEWVAEMEDQALYSAIADLVLVAHASFAAFVVFGLVLIFAGGMLRWRWVRNPYFRYAHLLAIGVVVLQSWLGVICPLTTWEMELRAKAGDAFYQGSFIAHWLHELLYYDAPPWVFAVCYSAFALLVVFSWWYLRPRPFGSSQ